MNDILINFHFLRPTWFYALIPALILFSLLMYRQRNNSNWEQAVDPGLLPHILDEPGGKVRRNPLTLVLVAWCLAILALAGPVWQKTPQPVHEREDALVILLDLSRSMYATDVKPTRLVRARHKLQDLLNLRSEGVTALVVFAGDAHTVSPLTDDTVTIAAMIPALTPEIMPAFGSQLAPALEKAVSLFEDAGITSGRILIITDEIRDTAKAQAVARVHRILYPVSVMSVGSSEGAPVLLNGEYPDAGFLKDSSGKLVIPKVDEAALADFASVAGGRFTPMTLTDEDLEYLLAATPLLTDENILALERDFDVWQEEGPWLLILLLPLAAFAFRRGWLWSLALLCLLPVDSTYAFEWSDLWRTKDQQGIEALQQGQPGRAAQLFKNPGWKGSALYRDEDYQNAASQFDNIDSTDGRYNLGNAFAKQMRLEEAIEAYDEALKIDPENEDAAFNRQLVQELIEQQQQQDGENQEQEDSGQEDQQQKGNSDQQQGGNEDQQQAGDSEQQQHGENEDQQQEGEPEQQQQAGNEDQNQDEEADQQQSQVGEENQLDADSEMDSEEKQALEQWLRRIPDDPGGLLRRKFRSQHEERLKQGQISRQTEYGDW